MGNVHKDVLFGYPMKMENSKHSWTWFFYKLDVLAAQCNKTKEKNWTKMQSCARNCQQNVVTCEIRWSFNNVALRVSCFGASFTSFLDWHYKCESSWKRTLSSSVYRNDRHGKIYDISCILLEINCYDPFLLTEQEKNAKWRSREQNRLF